MSDEQTALQIFIEESREHLGDIEEDLLAIEASPATSQELINKVFRAVHTIKGSSAFFALNALKTLAHAMESVLGAVRGEELTPSKALISVLLDSADMLKVMINNVAESEGCVVEPLIQALERFLSASAPSTPATTAVPVAATQGFAVHINSTTPLFYVDAAKLYAVQQQNNDSFIYAVDFSCETDLRDKKRTLAEALEDFEGLATIIAEQPLCNELHQDHVVVVCTSQVSHEVMLQIADVAEQRVHQLLIGQLQCTAQGHYLLPDGSPLPTYNPSPEAVEPPDEGVEQPTTSILSDASVASATTTKKGSLRVSIELLDTLMSLAGELVLTRNELVQNAGQKQYSKILEATQRVNNVTSALQEAIMSTRMQSIGIIFGKFRRVVRDLAQQLGKKITLEIEGEEVELDKSIIEAIGDPLTHLVRNSIDHGIESPAERTRLGKAEVGRLSLKASQEAGQVVITISDDGAGINPQRIKAKAHQQRLVSEAQLATMTERELLRLIFLPGFSTAETVTEISGRGVGMDVVQSNLTTVGGAIDIESTVGAGTTIIIKLPLTLAIIPSLLVQVESQRFAIPQANLIELVRIGPSERSARIQRVGDAEVLRLREGLLPLVRSSDVLGMQRTFIHPQSGLPQPERRRALLDRRDAGANAPPQEPGSCQRSATPRRLEQQGAVNVVVVSAGAFHYGLIVDGLLDSVEIVVKPLGSHLRRCREYAGATILGDGKVALILDIVGIKELQNMQDTQARIDESLRQQAMALGNTADTQSLLIVENGPGEFFGIPLGLISRIEKIRFSQINTAGGKRVVHYRGSSIPVYLIEDAASVTPLGSPESAFMTIFETNGREAGLLFANVIDTLQTDVPLDEQTHRQPGIAASLYLQERLCLLIDLYGMVKACGPQFATPLVPSPSAAAPPRVLIVEDSPFFLSQMQSFLQDAGYEVFSAHDGEEGLAVLQTNAATIDLVLTDIEMPRMDGFALTQAIRSDARFVRLPVIAVTSVDSDAAKKRGQAVGIDAWLIKLDRERVLRTCTHYLQSPALHERTGISHV
jgi:two-component system chemotaxis sensor kinase CheA